MTSFVKNLFKSISLQLPSPQLDISVEAAVQILFLSNEPDHVKHKEEACDECTICRLISIYAIAFNERNLSSLNEEIEKKVQHLLKIKTKKPSRPVSFVENIKSKQVELLPKLDEKLMIFCEALDMMEIKIPESLEKTRDAVFMTHKIPARKNQRGSSHQAEDEERNNFFAYTTNKKLSELGDSLTDEHVYAMRTTIIKAGSQRMLPELVEAMKTLKEHDNDPKFKDLLFYYIILNLRKYNLLNRLHNHVLKKLIEDSIPDGTEMKKSLKQLDRYPLTPKPPGVCVIFAMIEGREKGTVCDVEKLKELFEGFFNYDVHLRTDPTKEEIEDYANELKSARYMFYDSFIAIFLAHGNKSYLRVKNGKLIHRRKEFIALFANIGWLKKKPKLFFIQACADRNQKPSKAQCEGQKGETDSLDYGLSNDQDWNRTYANHVDGEMINSLADTLISYSTLWYEKASRDKSGSLYINTLIETLKESGKKKSIVDILCQVHYKVNTVRLTKVKDDGSDDLELWKQTPYYESSLEKKFIFPE